LKDGKILYEAKCPVDMPQDYPKEEIKKSIEMTEFLVKYIKNQLK